MPMTKEARQKKAQARRADLLARGLCPACGEAPPEEGRARCEWCNGGVSPSAQRLLPLCVEALRLCVRADLPRPGQDVEKLTSEARRLIGLCVSAGLMRYGREKEE